MKAPAHVELLSRLDHFSLTPKVVVDLEGRSDGSHGALRQRFPRSRLISTGAPENSTDASSSIVSRLFRRRPKVEHLACAAHQISLSDHSVDLVIAHDWSPGIDKLDASLKDIHRVLVPGGLFLCTAPSAASSPGQADIHDFGSALMRAGFVEPVLDIDRYAGEEEEVIHVAAFAGASHHAPTDGEVVVPFPKVTRR